MVKKDRINFERLFKFIKKALQLNEMQSFKLLSKWFYINLLIIKPFFLIKEKETDEFDEDTEFTAPLITAFFGRYDNESPPLLNVFFKDN